MRVFIAVPARNTARTIQGVIDDIPPAYRRHVLVVDDGSGDDTAQLARAAGAQVIVHHRNRGYGGAQKSLYTEALRQGADIVAMLHGDRQYEGADIPRLIAPIEAGEFDAVLGSRKLRGDPRELGMPAWRYFGNVFLTGCENRALGLRLTDYHSGLRAYSAAWLRRVRYLECSDDFAFDQQILVQGVMAGLRIGEISTQCHYYPAASSISFPDSVRYGLASLRLLGDYLRARSAPGSVPYLSPHKAADGR